MDHPRKYTQQDMRAVLQEAVLTAEPKRDDGYSLEDLEDAAKEAGIDEKRVRQAIQRVEQKKGFRSSLVFIALGAAVVSGALILLPGKALLGWRKGSVLLHNEHRHVAYTLEVLVPKPGRKDSSCDKSADAHLAASEYCVFKRIRLEPKRRTRIKVPHRPESCPQIWVRTYDGENLHRSAIFSLPVSVEVDRKGRLDQKGVGSPHMHPAPAGEDETLTSCPAGN